MSKHHILITLLLLLAATAGAQKIPNDGFEDWTTVGSYEMPDFWDNLNPTTEPAGAYTCTRGTPGSPGAAFLNLTSTLITGMGVVPGVAVCGVLDQASRMPVSGFAYDQRPEKFTGKWQYMMFGTGKGFMEVLLTRWNGVQGRRDTVAYRHYILNGMVMSWQTFSIPLTYFSGSYPDSCIIFLSASGTVAADFDYLWVDNLAFSGNVITGIPSSGGQEKKTRISPNPATGMATVHYSSDRVEEVHISITDLQGKEVKEIIREVVPGENSLHIVLEGVTTGSYFLTIRSSAGTETKKMIVR